jgi:phosphatidylserine decarboxylase
MSIIRDGFEGNSLPLGPENKSSNNDEALDATANVALPVIKNTGSRSGGVSVIDWDNIFSPSQLVDRNYFKGLSYTVDELKEDDLPKLYEHVEKSFRSIEHSSGVESWIQRGDLLDTIDALVKKDPKKFKHLNPNNPEVKPEFKPSSIALVDIKTVKAVNKVLGDQSITNLDELKDKFDILPENSKTAQIIHQATKQDSVVLNFFFRLIERIMTAVLGFIFKRPSLTSHQVASIASASIDMNIKPTETLVIKNENESKNEYRGPTFLFGKSLHEFKTVNDWFKRSLTKEATKLYVAKAELKESSLSLKYGPEKDDVSRVVISNSDSRLRFHDIEPGNFGSSYELTGKVLNPEAEFLAKNKGENPVYYEDKYKFSPKNLLGRLDSDPMGITSIDTQKGDKKVIAAQHELLGGMYRAFDRRGATQVIQRLAPEDVHNYVAPLNGTPLSNLQAANFLKSQEGVSDQEKAHFENLAKVFEEQEKKLGRPSQSTIDIYGTLGSVSTPAIQNRSSILSQNDRKIMLFKHEDGSFSMHVFIGATGVGKVDVATDTEAKKRGDRQGDMQFGSDTYDSEGLSTVKDTKTRDDLNKLKLGQWQGGFPINGSTVISYYLPKDFTLYPKLTEAKAKLAYGEASQRVEVELKAQMGSPILVKTEVAIAELLEQRFPGRFSDLAKIEGDELDSGIDSLISEIDLVSPKFATLLNGESQDSKDLRIKLKSLIASRLDVIKGYQELSQAHADKFQNLEEMAFDEIEKIIKEMPQSQNNSLNEIIKLLNKKAPTLEERMAIRKFEKQLIAYIKSIRFQLE